MEIVKFKHIQTTYPNGFPLDLLLLADPSLKNIEGYIYNSVSYLVFLESKKIGVLVLEEVEKNSLEVRNIAISETFQNRGFAKQTLQFATTLAKEKGYQKLRICTANSSISQLALYQKQGFEIYKINFNYFTENYSEKIVENDIICKHQICLEKKLHH